jgi:chaperone modulatory protein CbpM
MSTASHSVDAMLDDLWLDMAALCRLAGVTETWLQERVSLGLLEVHVETQHEAWRFGHAELHRVRRMARLERDFDAVPELAALVADLEDELAAVRARLLRQGG